MQLSVYLRSFRYHLVRRAEKCLSLLLLSSCCVLGSYAQVSIGVKAAVNNSTTKAYGEVYPWLLGYNAGIVCDYSVSRHIFISSGLLYSAKGDAFISRI